MPEETRRTFICAVAAVDMVEYTKTTIGEQLRLRDDFIGALLEAIEHVPEDRRIIVDTGGGALVSFLDDPEDALFMVLHLHQALPGAYSGQGFGGTMRSCINLGPVVLSRDVNGRPLTLGDGVNIARRLMRCADPGEIIVSRSCYDLLATVSADHAALFRDAGSRSDEDARVHEVYVVRDCERALEVVQRRVRG